MYRVILINRDIGTSVGTMPVPVSGRSGKLYGHAFVDVDRGGPIFELTLEAYDRDKFDIIGNPNFRCQWVPCFEEIPEPAREVAPKPKVNDKHRAHRKLVERAKKAGIYKNGMDDDAIKLALGIP